MLIRTQKDLTQMTRKQAEKQLLCAFCAQQVGQPPAIQVEDRVYHEKCAMQLVYAILEAVSGYGPEINVLAGSHPTMADAFREAAQQHKPQS